MKDRDVSDIFKFGVCAVTFNYINGKFLFDVGDVNYIYYDNILENVILDNVERKFKKGNG